MESVLYRINAGMVNQLMACHWIENGIEIENPGQSEIKTEEILKKVNKIKARKIKFDF